jgi:hypothetical protein
MLKPGATCGRRSAAKTGDSEYFPTGQYGDHHPIDGPELLSLWTQGCYVRAADRLHPVNGYTALNVHESQTRSRMITRGFVRLPRVEPKQKLLSRTVAMRTTDLRHFPRRGAVTACSPWLQPGVSVFQTSPSRG